eukprot:CAMPEP_0115012824 /NCGR_PEP_ID=MMETSP0216-20121206/24988_1 /TAXON_ID=223996 /ORGANISM="Protocruzia adherens, Strain Boccale" /LENGTH=172 /DNA_ID=CAMNT_0002381997 /DNA_START=39 /DNA_END=557 /DNA_ORIENTATION=-
MAVRRWRQVILILVIGVLSTTQALQLCDTKDPRWCPQGYCVVTSFSKSEAVCAVNYCEKGDCCTLADGDRTRYTCDKGKCKETDSCADHVASWKFWLGGGLAFLVILIIVYCCARAYMRNKQQRDAIDRSGLVNQQSRVQMGNPVMNQNIAQTRSQEMGHVANTKTPGGDMV